MLQHVYNQYHIHAISQNSSDNLVYDQHKNSCFQYHSIRHIELQVHFLSQNLAVLLRKGKNMIDITKVLNDILKAVLGKDVRQAIHDGVKRSNEIADDCDKRQANLENQYEQLIKNFSSSSPSNVEIVDARTGPDGTVYGTLRKRLEDPRCS